MGHFVGFVISVVCQSEKKLIAVEWNNVSDKGEQQLGQRLRISHAKVPEMFLLMFLQILCSICTELQNNNRVSRYYSLLLPFILHKFACGPQKHHAGSEPVHCLQIVKTANQKCLQLCSKGFNRDIS